MDTRAPMAAGIPTVKAIAEVVFPFSVLPNSSRVALWFSAGRPSGNSTSSSWCKSTMSWPQKKSRLSFKCWPKKKCIYIYSTILCSSSSCLGADADICCYWGTRDANLVTRQLLLRNRKGWRSYAVKFKIVQDQISPTPKKKKKSSFPCSAKWYCILLNVPVTSVYCLLQ